MLIREWKFAHKMWSVWVMVAVVVASLAAIWDNTTPEGLGLSPITWSAIQAMLALIAIPARITRQDKLAKKIAEYLKEEAGAAARRVGVAAAVVAAVTAVAMPLTTKWEGVRLTPYYDVVGVLTVCAGETEGVKLSDRYTKEECAEMLEDRLIQDYYLPLVACIPNLPEAPVPVQASFASWTYNVGVGAACGSTLARYAKAGDWREACLQLPRWNRGGGRVIQGLVNRRADELALCLSGLS